MTLTDDSETLFAALVHDLGKALSPAENLPHHYGHESAGVPLVTGVCERLKVPSGHRRLAELVCEHHLRGHRVLAMRISKVHDLFESLDGFRRGKAIVKFAIACEADARGRLGLERRDYPQSNYLVSAFESAKNVTAKKFVEAGKTGALIGQLLRSERIERMKELKRAYAN